ncbi:hypothetical protein [Paenibacillus bouchesdurhonensis]|uniref:hypothetical protein n=1 Tax=Paenibacillus bouchesdurhonensis TaxID=1870990 RepID=UPI001F460D23|nr:hypothetical protein [Paenibacillus bouchesdurhonensis]
MDPGRVGSLARDLERLERTMENGITGMSRELRRLACDVEAAYNDPSEDYVRSAARKVSGLLQEIEKAAERIDEMMSKKVHALRYAEGKYIKAEKDSARATDVKRSSTFTLKGTIQSWLQRFSEKGMRNVADSDGASSAESRPSLVQWIQGGLLEIQDASLVQRLDSVKKDERIASLLQIFDTGTANEQTWARGELEAIALGFKEIARNQAAYKIYAIYNNELYMGFAHQSAERERKGLAKLGVAEEWYRTSIRLSEFYKGSPLDACDYNPLKQNRSAMPKESELRLMIGAGMLNLRYLEWAKLNYDAVAAAIHRKAEREKQLQKLLDQYNQAVPAEDIRKMQQYLKDMNIYHGEITGKYNQEFLVAVAGYQHIANTISSIAAVRRDQFGWELFEVDGILTEKLLQLAYAESGYGISNDPNLDTRGMSASVTMVGVGVGIVNQLGDDVTDLVQFAWSVHTLNPEFWTETIPGYFAMGEAIATGKVTIHDIAVLIGDAAAEEFVVPFQQIIELQPKILSGEATYEESVQYGRALTKAYSAITIVHGAAKAGVKVTSKSVKGLLKNFEEAAQNQRMLATSEGVQIPTRSMDLPQGEPPISSTKPESGSSGMRSVDFMDSAGGVLSNNSAPGKGIPNPSGSRIQFNETGKIVISNKDVSLNERAMAASGEGILQPNPEFHRIKLESELSGEKMDPVEGIDNAKDITQLTVDDIPTAKSGDFSKFFNSLTSSELDELWKDKKIRKKIERQLREPGSLHEWHLVSRAPQFKYWNISAEEIKDLRTAISDVKFVNPNGVHGGLGSTKAHNELLAIIDTSRDYNTFVRRLNNWAYYRLEGGISSLPEDLRLK